MYLSLAKMTVIVYNAPIHGERAEFLILISDWIPGTQSGILQRSIEQ